MVVCPVCVSLLGCPVCFFLYADSWDTEPDEVDEVVSDTPPASRGVTVEAGEKSVEGRG